MHSKKIIIFSIFILIIFSVAIFLISKNSKTEQTISNSVDKAQSGENTVAQEKSENKAENLVENKIENTDENVVKNKIENETENMVEDKIKNTAENKTESPAQTSDNSKPISIEQRLSQMTLDQKIGQLFIVRPDSISSKTVLTQDTINLLQQYPVGGIALFSQNITSSNQLLKFTSDFQSSSSIPLFIGIDEEGGTVARIANSGSFNVTKFGNMDSIGSTGDTNNAYNVGKTIGTYLKQYGVNLDFAPVSDVNTNPNNIVIGKRAFGSDPTLVANMVKSEVAGFHDAGIMTTLKHFPGHGDTKGDTHTGAVSVAKTWDEMLNCEIIPFKENLQNTDMIMAAHISAPNVTNDNLPSSLSKVLITDKLRNELHYNGVVITDAFEMGAITDNYSTEYAVTTAINAGVDIILMPSNYIEAFNALKNSVQSGAISEARINESVSRILNLKEKYGLF